MNKVLTFALLFISFFLIFDTTKCDETAGTQHLILARTIGSALHVISSDESNTAVSQSLVVLTSPEINNGLRFENLLKAPAELLGRGENGSVYKVMCDNPNMTLVGKRIKDWSISGSEFKKRMQKLDQIRHPNVLPAVAFYSSRQEKLLVYEYQNNGIQTGQTFHWSSRLSIAVGVADALAFMHQELQEDRIAHGNLKSSNILKSAKQWVELASWVVSVLREEWTVEVFDRTSIQEGASEERMVNLLQVAVKCVNHSPEARPSINQVALMDNHSPDARPSIKKVALVITSYHYTRRG
ncbi:hypothetical protein RND71_013390 [Anisodus tanguticus]|uniref:Protein kinase domain-containing protein n=1 Tax=Anisodus tanguticus TaxID=243964 RepID=A0AAE1SEV5_9SOLA|nr:hypothetical protein RND71_013390 [Anisodus tanguticus]